MEKSSTYQYFLEKWTTEGMARGMAQGEAQGEARGELSAYQKNILLILGHRFGGVPEEIANKVRTIHGIPQLESLLEAAVDCPNAAAFGQQFN